MCAVSTRIVGSGFCLIVRGLPRAMLAPDVSVEKDEVRAVMKAADGSKDTYKEIAILTKGLEKYPNSLDLKIALAFSLSMYQKPPRKPWWPISFLPLIMHAFRTLPFWLFPFFVFLIVIVFWFDKRFRKLHFTAEIFIPLLSTSTNHQIFGQKPS